MSAYTVKILSFLLYAVGASRFVPDVYRNQMSRRRNLVFDHSFYHRQ